MTGPPFITCQGETSKGRIADRPILTEDQKAFLGHFQESPLRFRFYVTGATACTAF